MSEQRTSDQCACGTKHEDHRPPATKLHYSHGPFCSITGNKCGTDTWAMHAPPDCRCGVVEREMQRLREFEWMYEGLCK